MLFTPHCFSAGNRASLSAMTYRVYLRWPNQLVSNKTVTDSRAVADSAFAELVARSDLAAEGALGVAFTHDGKQIEYRAFDKGPQAPIDDTKKR